MTHSEYLILYIYIYIIIWFFFKLINQAGRRLDESNFPPITFPSIWRHVEAVVLGGGWRVGRRVWLRGK